MTAKEFFKNEEWITGSRKPKEKQLFGYYDLLKFAELYHQSELKLLGIDGAKAVIDDMEIGHVEKTVLGMSDKELQRRRNRTSQI